LTDRFNTFDITLVIANFITLCLEEMLTAGELDFVNPRMLRIVRVLRILRTLRAIRMLKSLRELAHITGAHTSPVFWVSREKKHPDRIARFHAKRDLIRRKRGLLQTRRWYRRGGLVF